MKMYLNQLIIFSLMGASGLLSHWCLAQAFKMSDTTFVMPLQLLLYAVLKVLCQVQFYFFILRFRQL